MFGKKDTFYLNSTLEKNFGEEVEENKRGREGAEGIYIALLICVVVLGICHFH